jgi:hypothetical protein
MLDPGSLPCSRHPMARHLGLHYVDRANRHAAGARDAGMETPPVMVLIYGHTKGSTLMMLAIPSALEFPLPIPGLNARTARRS